MKKIVALLIGGLCASQYSVAQNNSISIAPIVGLNLSTSSNDALKGKFYGMEASYYISMDNNTADWVRMLNVKDVSISATYMDTQNISRNGIAATRGVIGSNYSISSRLNISLWNSGDTRLLFAPGLGLAYVTQTFYTDKNFVFGSHINAVIEAGMKVETPISPSTKIQLGINLRHISNANSQSPNCGINTATASLGLVQSLSTYGPSSEGNSDDGTGSKHSFEFDFGAGHRDQVKTGVYKNPNAANEWFYYDTAGTVKKTGSNLYQVGMYAGYNYRLNPVFGLRVGSDVVYYTHPFSYDNFLKTYQSSFSSYDHFSVGLSAGVDIWLGRFAVSGNYGRYLHFNSLQPEHYYWTGGIKYFVLPWMALNAKVYWHGGQSHYPNFGVVLSSKKVFH